MKRSIFTFNHIDNTIDPTELTELKALYKYYHRLEWCHRLFKRFKRMSLGVNISSNLCIIVGTVVGRVTLNQVVLASISGCGLWLKVFSEFKKYPRKIETSKFVYTTYQKGVVDLRDCIRGTQFNHDSFISDMKLLDDIIIQM